MEKSRKGHGFSSLALRGAFVVLLVSMFAAYISDQVEISSRRQELAAVQAQLSQQEADNEELNRLLEGDDEEILERIARDTYGYAAPNERVFVIKLSTALSPTTICGAGLLIQLLPCCWDVIFITRCISQRVSSLPNLDIFVVNLCTT